MIVDAHLPADQPGSSRRSRFADDDWPCDPRPFYPEAHWRRRVPAEGDVGRAGHATHGARLRSFLQPVRRRCGPGHAGHRSRADARSGTASPSPARRPNFYEPSREAMKARLPGRGHRRPELRRWRATRPTVERAARAAALSLFRQALQQLFERRSLPPLARRVAGRLAPAGTQDHAAPRRSADRGVHRRDGSHGARRGESRRSGAAQDLHADRVSVSRRRDVQAFGDEMGRVCVDGAHFRSRDPALDARVRDVSARFSSRSAARASAAAICASTRTARRSCWKSIPTAASTTCPPTPAAPTLCLLHDPEGHAGLTRRLDSAALVRQQRRIVALAAPAAARRVEDFRDGADPVQERQLARSSRGRTPRRGFGAR